MTRAIDQTLRVQRVHTKGRHGFRPAAGIEFGDIGFGLDDAHPASAASADRLDDDPDPALLVEELFDLLQ
ncbi:hypothetical protein D3C78_1281860 [compost metagenome]